MKQMVRYQRSRKSKQKEAPSRPAFDRRFEEPRNNNQNSFKQEENMEKYEKTAVAVTMQRRLVLVALLAGCTKLRATSEAEPVLGYADEKIPVLVSTILTTVATAQPANNVRDLGSGSSLRERSYFFYLLLKSVVEAPSGEKSWPRSPKFHTCR
jgi:anaerobic C4-dicarboxylate transporter